MNAGRHAADGRARWVLVVLLALGLVVRLALALVTPEARAVRFPDSAEYLAIGESVVAGRGFVLPERVMGERKLAQRMPGYPLLVAAAWWWADAPVRALLSAQAVMGAATVALVAWMAWRLAGVWAAVVAVALLAFDPYQAYFAALVLVEVPLGLALTAALAAGLVFLEAERGRWAWAVVAGLALAVATYLHPSALGFAALVGVLAIFARRRRRFLAAWALGTAACLAALAPWAARNAARLGRPVLTTNVGASLYDGTQVEQGGASDLSFRERVAAETAALDEVGRDAFFRRRATERIAADPVAWMHLGLKKVARTWSPGPNLAEGQTPLHQLAGYTSLLPTAALAVVALVALARRRRAVAVWLVAPAVYVTMLHAVFVGSVRYRLPAMPALAVLGGVGLAALLTRRPAERAATRTDGPEPAKETA